MKGFTDIEQSKKLSEILPIESADMYWKNGVSDKYIQCFTPFVGTGAYLNYDYDVPCWSLAALLQMLPHCIDDKYWLISGTLAGNSGWYVCYEEDIDQSLKYYIARSNLIDACYEMILGLHKEKLL